MTAPRTPASSAGPTTFRLRTLGSVQLNGPSGPIALDDPVAAGLLVILAVQGPSGVPVDQLLLRLTPDLTPANGRTALAAAAARLEGVLGPHTVLRDAGPWRLATGALEADVVLFGDGAPLAAAERREFLKGLALENAPEFAEWIEASRPSLRRGASAAGRRKARWPRAAALGAVAVVAAAVFWLTRPPDTLTFTAGDPLLLADLENAAGDTLFDRSLILAAEVALRQSGQVQLVPRVRVVEALRRMQIADSGTALTLALARDVAAREGIRYVLGIRAERREPGYEIAATLVDATRDRVAGQFSAPAETRAGTLAALDRVLSDVRSRLGVQAESGREPAAPLPQVTTPSLEALRSYAVGVQAWSQGDYRLARDLWERAVALDTGFAMAMGALGGWHYWHNRPADGARFYQEALRRRARLTDWERLSLEEASAASRGDLEAAGRIARTIAETFPTASTWYNYGTTLLQAGRFDPAIEALRHALTFDAGHTNSLVNIATATKALGRYAEALAAYEAAGRSDSTVLLRGSIAADYGYTLHLAGRTADAERHFRALIDRPGLFERTLGHRGLAFLAVAGGRFEDAVGSFRQATEASRQQRAPLSIARGRLLEGLALLLAGDSADARRTLGEVASSAADVPLPPQILMLLGHAWVRAGRPAEAARILARLAATADTARRSDRGALAFLQADQLLAQGRADTARRLLSMVQSQPQALLTVVRTAEAHAAAGQVDSAIAGLAGEPDAGIGSESYFDWIASRFTLAELLRSAGRTTQARSGLDSLAARWAEADTGALIVRALQRRRAGAAP